MPHSQQHPPSFPVVAWTPALRWVAALALAVAAGNVLYLLARLLLVDVLQGVPATPPPVLASRLVLLSLLPWVLALLLRRLASGTLHLEPERLLLRLRHATFEIPLASIASLHAWRIPLPGAGLVLHLQSGRRFHYRLQPQAPLPLLEALAPLLPSAEPLQRHPALRFANARAEYAPRRLRQLLLKFALFPLLPTAIFFRAHQYIAYGGLLGEYHMLGLASYLKSLAGYWLTTTALLVLYATLWRALVEGLTFSTTWAMPLRSRGLRQLAEWALLLLYYLGVPALVALRFLL